MKPNVLARYHRGLRKYGLAVLAEATLELALARIQTLLPARTYLHASGLDRSPPSGNRDSKVPADAMRICHAIQAVASRMPFRAVCLQQALVAQSMLKRRGYPAVLHLGIGTAPTETGTRGAHAWVSVLDAVVCGDHALGRYAVVARFT